MPKHDNNSAICNRLWPSPGQRHILSYDQIFPDSVVQRRLRSSFRRKAVACRLSWNLLRVERIMLQLRLFAFLVAALALSACGGGSSGNNSSQSGDPGEPTVNFLGTWSADFTPDICMETTHTGIATFVPLSSDTTLIDGDGTIVEFPTFGCPNIPIAFGEIFQFDPRFPYPLEITEALFTELLNNHFDYTTGGTFTIVQFTDSYVSFHREVFCSSENVYCGMFELTR